MRMLDDDFRGGVLATCAFAREKTAYGDVARMMDARAGGGESARWRPVKMAARGAVLAAALGGGAADPAARASEAVRDARRGANHGSKVVEKMYPIDAAFEAGDGAGLERACAEVVARFRRRRAAAAGAATRLAVTYRRLDNVLGESTEGEKGAGASEDAVYGRKRITPSVASAIERAFKRVEPDVDVTVDLKDPTFVVFVQVFSTRSRDDDDARKYVVGVGAYAKEDEAFEVRSRGIFPVSVKALTPKEPPKWMIKKGLVEAPKTTSATDGEK
ncbi:hypothetical protein BE221DRAFT_146200 [Ostreococcus tauri]|uniref:Uncharacterized protein n=1 Tax=Ostreococcus tauri TaxID=70448 RepID=A0A1Y5IFU0_OSTTA|nr:hypothetical protein BE221DRAFT_146200 [Ostreococcus tauri]